MTSVLHATRRTRGARLRHRVVASIGTVAVVGGLAVGVPTALSAPAMAAPPASATDATKVPHYFGPWTNWANSPLTQSKADVQFIDPLGTGTGAAAVAQLDPATGGITKIDVTAPGHDYSQGTTVTVAGSTDPAAATPTIQASGGVVRIDVPAGGTGAGYTAFKVDITGDGTGAAATASGGVDNVDVSGGGGSGYTFPTVDFDLPDDPNGTIAKAHVDPADLVDGVVQKVTVDDPGSGYSTPPRVEILNGTRYDPISLAAPAKAVTSLKVVGVTVDNMGTGYTTAPAVSISDPNGTNTSATATAVVDAGGVAAVAVSAPGTGYLTKGMKKFQDSLPVTCNPGRNGDGCPAVAQLSDPGMDAQSKFIPLAVPEATSYNGEAADEYVIGLVQYRTKFSSDLPATLVRGYVQLSTAAVPGQQVPLFNELLDGSQAPVPGGYTGVTAPQWLGPIIAATKDKPVRIVFRNLLPNGANGDLFLPTDSSGMGSGMGPMAMPAAADQGLVTDKVRNPECTQEPKGDMCFKDNRATLHLHGGTTPWISDGTPHQWITPAGENTPWPQGVSVSNVPDMVDGNAANCDAANDGCQTFFYTNQQSARLMFYHDHSWGITRLNVYAGEAAGYLISDDTEKKLIADKTIPDAADTIPLIVQDRTFVPDDSQLYGKLDGNGQPDKSGPYGQDPTWDAKRWGSKGSFWYHHVYMPAQNPGDASGMSAYGRWMYGPWFWPPASGTVHGPIANPYYDPACKVDDPNTWTYQTDPFCEPEQIPGTPNISMGMEQFNDTPIVNGVAYPKVTLQPKTYRMRLLNAANDRFFNFQWYTADPTQGDGTTEVALKPAELLAAQTDPNVSPTPVGSNDNAFGPDWVQIASEGGFLPKPAVIDGQQPTTWITDPTRFDVGNVDKHSLLLAPAERADVIVDFSKFAGETLILYNDAPAAFPARVPSYDYFTGAPDMSPNGAPTILPGYGPNTRTVMQVTISNDPPAAAFDLTKLTAAFRHHADGSGVFESGQHPTIVGQAAYNSAYGTSFASNGNCSKTLAGATAKCDGLVRVDDTAKFQFNTLKGQAATMSMPLQPKAIHDEMNSSTFDEFGRMQANLGIEAQPPTPGLQNVTLYPYVNPQTELIDGTNLPKDDLKVTPISDAGDGSQIWRITHNGVDTHPIHFHLYDVQVLNRVTWDNIIIPVDDNELGWKDTVRISPLEDTIVALRPIVPKVPFEVPNSVRPLNPMMPTGDTSMFNNIDPQGNPTANVTNQLVNFGWEYVYHCHILSHEEMDMMRPVSLALPPNKADGLAFTLVGSGNNRRVRMTWNDNSINETSFVLQRTTNGTTWTDVGTSLSPLDQPNTHGPRALTDTTSNATTPYLYRVVALNKVGYGAEFPSMTVRSVSDTLPVDLDPLPAAPTTLTATLQQGPRVTLSWRDNATTETGFLVERATGAGAFSQIATAPARANTGTATFVDTTAAAGATYRYRVTAVNLTGSSAPSNEATIVIPALPTQPIITSATVTTPTRTSERISIVWTPSTGQTGYRMEWSTSNTFTTVSGSTTVGAAATTATSGTLAQRTWYVRVVATNTAGTTSSPIATVPLAAPPVLGFAAAGVTANSVTIQLAQPGLLGFTRAYAFARSHGFVVDDDDDVRHKAHGVRLQWSRTRSFAHLVGSRLVGPKVHKVTVRNLTAHTRYFFRARTISKAGHKSVWSKPLMVRTKR